MGDITFDNDNVMWFSWASGLWDSYISKYDGKKLETHRIDYVSMNPIQPVGLQFDRNGELWISTDQGDLGIFNILNSSNSFIIHPQHDKYDFPVFDKNNKMWLPGGSHGVFSYENTPTSISLIESKRKSFLTVSPNPTNQLLITKYELREAGYLKLSLFNQLGQEMAVLDEGWKEAGENHSEFRIQNSELPDGMYFVRLSAGGKIETEKVIIMK